MFSQVQLFVLIVLVAGLQCSPAPAKYITGFSHGINAQTSAQAKANGKGSLSNGLADGNGSAKLGASGSGGVDGSVFVQANDNIYEMAGDYHGSAGGWINPKWNGRAGKNADGKLTGGAGGKWASDGEHSGAGSGGINTNEDALIKFNEHHSRTAADILRAMDDDNDY